MNELIAGIIGLCLLLAAIIIPLNILESMSCSAKWRDSGFEHRYSLMGGCQIKMKTGVWIPAGNYRDVAN